MIGQTQDGSFQIGVRRTFALTPEDAWKFLVSAQGQRLWLGETCFIPLQVGTTYTTPSGVKGVVRVVNPLVNLRLTWQPQAWGNASTIQVRTISKGKKTVISFHQEGLLDAAVRAQRRQHWQQVIAALETHFSHQLGSVPTTST